MAKSKPRKPKKHNMQKRKNHLSRGAVKNLATVFILNDNKYANLISLKTGKNVDIDSTLDKAIRKVEHMWSVMTAVFCVKASGEQYIKYSVLHAERPCIQAHLDKNASEVHTKLIRSCNENHIIGIGWIATPYKYDFPDELDDFYESIFDRYGAWTPAKDVLLHKVREI